MNDYTPFNNAIVVYKEATVSQIVPKSGPRAGQKTSVVEFKAYKPEFEKKADGTFEKKDSKFFTVQYYGSEVSAKRIAAGIKEGMTLEVRGELREKQFTGKDGKTMTENVIGAKGIAVSLNQPGLEIQFSKQKHQQKGQER
ncbi:hypothetical protein [uncultured Turicimonas sp.]|uniref:hypothetical protein n=1 Tax=uncultured Turicimonas sp. TaxID=1918607 RepID=UPI0028061165|nr:hypothetical protein [uncultured Turicimonas sp.]